MIRSTLPKQTQRRHGTVAVVVAVCLMAILGVVALALDGGTLLNKRRHVQAAADAAALAAAKDLFDNYIVMGGLDLMGTAEDSARAIAKANGYDNSNSVVTVRVPPQSGSHAGKESFAEVSIEYQQVRYFSRIFGSGTIPIKARAVASGETSGAHAGIIILNRTKEQALHIRGKAAVRVLGDSSVIVNSNHAQAGFGTGSASIQAKRFDIVGGLNNEGHFKGPVRYGIRPVLDPLRHVPEPDPYQLVVRRTQRLLIDGGTHTLQPGIYQGGIVIQSQSNVTLTPGIYYLQGTSNGGGFLLEGGAMLTAKEVMFFNAPTQSTHEISLAGSGAVTIYPPTSGPYTGISVFQHRDATIQPPVRVAGGSLYDVRGTFYIPKGQALISGGNDSIVGSQYIVDTLEASGNGTLNILYDAKDAARVTNVRLVE